MGAGKRGSMYTYIHTHMVKIHRAKWVLENVDQCTLGRTRPSVSLCTLERLAFDRRTPLAMALAAIWRLLGEYLCVFVCMYVFSCVCTLKRLAFDRRTPMAMALAVTWRL